MQHLTCIDVNNRSTKQKYSLHCNTDYKYYNILSVLILAVSPLTIEPDSMLIVKQTLDLLMQTA